jgi:hypothetical protein
MAGAGHNLKMSLKKPRFILAWLLNWRSVPQRNRLATVDALALMNRICQGRLDWIALAP